MSTQLSNYSSLASAVSTIGSTPATLEIGTSETTSTTFTIPANITLRFVKGGSITVSAGVITIIGPIDAPPMQIFSASAGSIVFGVSSTQREVYPEWWGAIANDSTDCLAATNAALTSLPNAGAGAERGGIVRYGVGIYRHSNTLTIPAKWVQLRGEGYHPNVNAGFGTSTWLTGVLGTVLKFTHATNDAVRIDQSLAGNTTAGCTVVDLAIVGPATLPSQTTGTGLTIGSATVAGFNITCDKILVANFTTGLRLMTGNSNLFRGVDLRACTTALQIQNGHEAALFDYLYVKFATTGIHMTNAHGITFQKLIAQICTTGTLLQPGSGDFISNTSFQGCHWEDNTTHFHLDVTNGAITQTGFTDSRTGGTGVITFTNPPSPSFGLGRTMMSNCDFKTCTITPCREMGELVLDVVHMNELDLSFLANDDTGFQARGIRYQVAPFKVDKLSTCFPYTIAYAAAVTLSWSKGAVQRITLAGNITFTMPTDAPVGASLELIIIQDVTGGRTVSWTGLNHHSWSNTGNTANKQTNIRLYNNGSGGIANWTQMGAQSPYMT